MADGTTGGKARKGPAALWIILILIVLGTAAVAVVWGIGNWRVSQVEREASEQLSERTLVLSRARAATLAQAVAVLSRDALAEGRTETLQGAYDELVREPGVRGLVLFDAGGRAVVATDRRLLGTVADDPDLAGAATAQGPVVGDDTVYVPVMGFTRRLGTLRLEFDPAAEALFGGEPASEEEGPAGRPGA